MCYYEVGVPFGVNNLFIDNESDVEKIKARYVLAWLWRKDKDMP